MTPGVGILFTRPRRKSARPPSEPGARCDCHRQSVELPSIPITSHDVIIKITNAIVDDFYYGSGGGDRTHDQVLNRHLLYR